MINDIDQADTRDINVTVQDSDGVVFNVTGYTVKLYVKENMSDSVYLIENTGSITSASTGEIKVSLSTTDTNIAVGKYYYWIVINISTTSIYTVNSGSFNIVEGK